jgi:hypothetical protein
MAGIWPFATDSNALILSRFRSVPVIERFSAHTESEANDPGCAKTLEAVVSAQQENQTCGLGE